MAEEVRETVRKVLALGVFAVTLSVTLWWNETSIYPVEAIASFAVLLTVFAAALVLRAGAAVPLSFTIRIISVPIGLYVSLLSLIQAAELGHGFIGIFLAMITAGLLFVCCLGQQTMDRRLSLNAIVLNAAIMAMLLIPIGLYRFFAQFPLSALWEPAIALLAAGSFIALYLMQTVRQSVTERLVFAGGYNLVLQAVIGVMIYIIVTQWITQGLFVQRIGAISVSLLYALALYLSTLVIAISKHETGDVAKIDVKNWHIVEGYLFFMAMVVAPPSIIEYILSQNG
jgi:hypothetical protein